jgi:putative membrane protein
MNWQHLANGVLNTIIFGVLGIALMLLGFKAFDWITPKIDVEQELAKDHNIAVAIVVAAVIVGISIIIGVVVAG